MTATELTKIKFFHIVSFYITLLSQKSTYVHLISILNTTSNERAPSIDQIFNVKENVAQNWACICIEETVNYKQPNQTEK
jgi:hypothetical protein